MPRHLIEEFTQRFGFVTWALLKEKSVFPRFLISISWCSSPDGTMVPVGKCFKSENVSGIGIECLSKKSSGWSGDNECLVNSWAIGRTKVKSWYLCTNATFRICKSIANPKKFCDLMSVITSSISSRMRVWEVGCDWETVKRKTRMNKSQRSIWDQESLQKWWWGWRWLAPSGIIQDMH